MSIDFEPNSEAPHFSHSELSQMREMIRADVDDFDFDPAYVAFIEDQNGGRPLLRFISGVGGGTYDVDEFLHYGDTRLIYDVDTKFLNANVAWSAIEDRLGPGLIPFAMSAGGDFYCFDKRPDGRGGVVLWMHGMPEKSPIEIASDFTDFLNRMGRKFEGN